MRHRPARAYVERKLDEREYKEGETHAHRPPPWPLPHIDIPLKPNARHEFPSARDMETASASIASFDEDRIHVYSAKDVNKLDGSDCAQIRACNQSSWMGKDRED